MPAGHMGTLSGTHLNIFARFHFVKLLPLRGRHVCMEEVHIFARFHFVKLLPLRGRHVCMEEVHIFARFHFVNFLLCGLLRAL